MSGYGMGGYVGNFHDKRRIERQQKEREEERKQLEELRRKAEAQAAKGPLRDYVAGTSEMLEHAFKAETVGLVTRDEFVQKRETLQERMEVEAKKARLAREEAEAQEKDRQRAAKRAKIEAKLKLSFDEDGEEEEEEEAQQQPQQTAGAQEAAGAKSEGEGDGAAADKPSTWGADDPTAAAAGGAAGRRFATLGKDPSVRTDFLPDKDRQREEEELREQLKKEWALRQAAVKAEPLEITYSYYNGTGHRRKVTVRKGDTVGQFLKAVHEQLSPQFREIRTTSVGSLMYVKEDIILPHTVSFYDLIVNKARGKSGPLFQFDVQEHVVMTFDPRLKSQDAHPGKVVDRHWYNKNKHIFPASHWAVYDPDKAIQGLPEDHNLFPGGK